MRTDLLKFYRNECKNNQGITLSDIWSYSDQQLEEDHNYIQWLFPTNNASFWNRSAPVLSEFDIAMLSSDEIVMKNFRKSLVFFLRFYGLALQDDDGLAIDNDFAQRAERWITRYNHNYRRMSRILRFLTLFGLNEIKQNLLDMLEMIYMSNEKVVGKETYQIWTNI